MKINKLISFFILSCGKEFAILNQMLIKTWNLKSKTFLWKILVYNP